MISMALFVLATRAFALVSATPSLAHLSGVFLNPSATTAAWNRTRWSTDFGAMKDIGIDFAVFHHPVKGVGPPTAQCPYGNFTTKFPPSKVLPAECFQQEIGEAGAALLTMLDALADVGGVQLHLGLAYTFDPLYALKSGFPTYSKLQILVARGMWASIPEDRRLLIGGIYAMIEPHNGRNPWNNQRDNLAAYFESLGATVKHELRSDLLVWDSPYTTGDPSDDARQGGEISPGEYAEWWGAVFDAAPHFDLIAPQDHIGQNHSNSFKNVTDYVTALAEVAASRGRQMWSNLEAFGQRDSEGVYICHNCVAQWKRFHTQLTLEGSIPHVTKLISWEWTGCLDPNYGPKRENSSWALYQQYKSYFDGGVLV